MQDLLLPLAPRTQTPPSTTSVTSSCCSRLAASKVTFLVLGNLELLLATVALLGSLLFGFSEYIVVAISTVVAVLIILTLYFSLHVVNKNEAWVVSYNELAGEKESLEAKCQGLSEEKESLEAKYQGLSGEKEFLEAKYQGLSEEKEFLEAKCRELGEENESVKSLNSRLEEKKKHGLSGKVTSLGSKVSKHF
ncbi:hypothetical protein CpecA_0535 [Chlamydia pecorum IPTaLE]|uniref:hypothetical protein n=1 Tax=Chlamydia pecorum TaxID=85991 RepID=UPI0003D403A9|nr:hypothetical protein [Chlamydia pecorum]ETF40372.1 hypothetical protein CpecA_0535 [Chlamydia pecorum IPTaLE]